MAKTAKCTGPCWVMASSKKRLPKPTGKLATPRVECSCWNGTFSARTTHQQRRETRTKPAECTQCRKECLQVAVLQVPCSQTEVSLRRASFSSRTRSLVLSSTALSTSQKCMPRMPLGSKPNPRVTALSSTCPRHWVVRCGMGSSTETLSSLALQTVWGLTGLTLPTPLVSHAMKSRLVQARLRRTLCTTARTRTRRLPTLTTLWMRPPSAAPTTSSLACTYSTRRSTM